MKIGKCIIPVSLAALCTFSSLSWGADPAPVPRPAGPVIAAFGPAGTGIPAGKFAVVLNYQYIETDGIRSGSHEVSNAVKMYKNVGIAKFRYGIVEGLDIRTATPFYTIDKKTTATGKEENLGWIGDSAIALHKVLMNQAKGAPFDLAVDLGLIVPTTDVSSKSVDFIGNGAWGGGGAVGLTYSIGSHRLDQEFHLYTFTEGAHDYRKPSYFRSTTAWGYIPAKLPNWNSGTPQLSKEGEKLAISDSQQSPINTGFGSLAEGIEKQAEPDNMPDFDIEVLL